MNAIINYIKKINWRILAADFISGVLLLVFLYTAWSKLKESEQFRYTLSQSQLLSPFVDVIAWLLPVTELALAVLLFIPAARLIGLLASSLLLVALTLYLTYMVLYDPNLPCSCGGVLAEMTWKQHIFFNLLLLLLSIIGLRLYKKEKGKLNKSPPTLKPNFQNSLLN